jgi:pimeloyl-ACP methyl ester carboxylesterase
MARDHRDVVRGLVVCATAAAWDEPGMKLFWRTMGVTRLYLTVFPRQAWRWALRASGLPDSQTTSWTAAELSRGAGRDLAEAGRELGRYDATTWIAGLDAPRAVILTTKDTAVPPARQRALAAALSAPVFEVHGDHGAVIVRADEFNAQLLAALDSVRDPRAAATR